MKADEEVGKARFIFRQQLVGPWMIALPLPLLAGALIRETPLIMLPIKKPHDLRGLMLHL